MVNGRQLYKCHACGKQFLGGERRDPEALFTAYFEGKQTYGQLAERYGCSAKTIQRCLDRAKPTLPVPSSQDGMKSGRTCWTKGQQTWKPARRSIPTSPCEVPIGACATICPICSCSSSGGSWTCPTRRTRSTANSPT